MARLLPAIFLLLCFSLSVASQTVDVRAEQLRALLRSATRLPVAMRDFHIQAPAGDWAIDFVSSLAVDRAGIIYLLQRGSKADPVLAVNREGKILRSWGHGLYEIPHSIRIDPAGNIWTVDAASSMVYKFSPEGKQMLKINVGGLPEKPASAFCGTTDIAFSGDRVFISDGYANARILEYNANGKLIREWGKPGIGPGEFHLPHAIAIGPDDVIYVADRENGRIQRFHLDGKYIDAWDHLGKTFSLKITSAGDLWIGTQPHNVANGVECWLVKVDRRTGKVLGAIESGGHHSIDLNSDGEPMTGMRPNRVLRFAPTG